MSCFVVFHKCKHTKRSQKLFVIVPLHLIIFGMNFHFSLKHVYHFPTVIKTLANIWPFNDKLYIHNNDIFFVFALFVNQY